MNTTHTIINGDCRNMKELADCSVQLAVTSPPSRQLKDYGSTLQIGSHDSYDSYINQLNLVWQEVYRVLDWGCRFCVNIGDQYARSIYYGRYKVIPIRTEIIRFCETVGFDYMGAIIWQKVATVNTSGGAAIMGSYPFPRNGIVKLDYEFILIFKKHGESGRAVSKEIKEQSRMTKDEWNSFFYGHWNFPGEKQSKHLAMFPVELPRRLIKMFAFVGDTVLDPFAGSGTTSLAALELDRNSVGYEINREFIPVIKEKLRIQETRLYSKPEFRFPRRESPLKDFSRRIEALPYVFKDPVELNQKTDPKKRQFGSRIDKNSGKREDYFRVKQILSPGRLVLNDGREIRLIGIKEEEQNREQAMAFLERKLRKQQVFLKFDPAIGNGKPGEQFALPCYLYLKNKTFINAHLIKEKLVGVDETEEFKKKERFLRYAGVDEVE
ncbi:MAG: site-specific DNA-methyltransferase [bacterium]|nr:site-specific DNA-methyltransferase [bacterium]